MSSPEPHSDRPAADFERLLLILGRTDGRIRISHATTGATSQFTPGTPIPIEYLDRVLEAHNDAQHDTWFEVNPARAVTSGRASAADVTRLAALYADLDVKDGGLSSFEDIANVIDDLEYVLGVPAAARVQTGHGVHAYWPIHGGDITDANRADVIVRTKRWKLLVEKIAAIHGGAVDNVFDLARILRVPGTFNHKDTALGLPRVLASASFDEGAFPITFQQLDETLEEQGIPQVVPEQGRMFDPSQFSAMSTWEWAEQDCDFVGQLRAEISVSVPASRHSWALKQSVLLHCLIRNGCITEASFEALVDVFLKRFEFLTGNTLTPRALGQKEIADVIRWGRLTAEQMDEPKLLDEMRGHMHVNFLAELTEHAAPAAAPQLEPHPLAPAAQIVPPPAKGNVSSLFTGQLLDFDKDAPESAIVTDGALALDTAVKTLATTARLFRAAHTDVGNGELLARNLKDGAMFVPNVGWHVWNTPRWVPDERNQVQERAKDTMMSMLETANTDEARKWAYKSMSGGAISTAIRMASSVDSVVCGLTELDTDAYTLCTPGGIVGLRTGILRTANPSVDRHTKMTAFTPDDEAPMTEFGALLSWALSEDAEVIAYLQRLFGAAAIGEMRLQVLPILWGPKGNNGKSTILSIIRRVFGDYGMTMAADLLLEKRNTNHPTELADLRGKRFAIGSEVPASARLDEALVKRLTGERTLKGRLMGKDFVEFANTGSYFMSLNHLPAVAVGGPSWWKRIRLIEFHRSITGREDVDLENRIVDNEGGAILNWIIQGAQDLLAHGERAPRAVLNASSRYRKQEDRIERFITATLTEDATLRVNQDVVYETYRRWCDKEGFGKLHSTNFYREFTAARPDADDGLGSYEGFGLQLGTAPYSALAVDPEAFTRAILEGNAE